MTTLRDEFIRMMQASYPDGCEPVQWEGLQDAFYAGFAVCMIRTSDCAVNQTRVNGVKETELLWQECVQYMDQRKNA
jgi:hypothetical protein